MTMQKMVNGVVVDMTPDEEAEHLAQVAIDNSIESRRASAWSAIKAKRDQLSNDGGYKVTVSGVDKWFHSDVKSKVQQLALFAAGARVPAVPWKTMDGSFVTMSQSLAAAIYQAAAAQDMAIFAKAEQHKAAMEASADPASYDFSGGWPATYAP